MNLFMLILLPTLSLGNKIVEVTENINEQNVPESPRLMGNQQNEGMQKYLDRIRRHQPTTPKMNDGTSMPTSTKITIMNYNYLRSYHLNHEKYQNLEEKKSLIKKSKRLRRSERSTTNSDNVDKVNEQSGQNIVKFELIDAKMPDSDSEKMMDLSKVQVGRNARSKKDTSFDELSTVVVAPAPPRQSISSSHANAQYTPIGELPIGVQNTINNMLFQQEQRQNYSINDKNPMEIGKRLYNNHNNNNNNNNNNNGYDGNQSYGYLNNLQKNYYLNNKMKQNILSNKLNNQLDQIRSKRLHAIQTKKYHYQSQPLQLQLQHHQQQQQQQPKHQQPSPAQYPQFIKTYRFTTLDQPFIPSIPMPETKETKLQKSAFSQIGYVQHLPPVNINYVFKDIQQPAPAPSSTSNTEQSHPVHPIQYAFPYIDLVKYTHPIRYGGDQLILHQQQQQQQHLQLNQQQQEPTHNADQSVDGTIHSGGGGGLIYGEEIDVGALSSLLGKSPATQLNGFNKLLQQSSELTDHQNAYQRPQDSTSPVKFPISELSGGKAQHQSFLDISANLSPIPNKDHTPIIEHSDENIEKPVTIIASPPSTTIRHSSPPLQPQSNHQHQQPQHTIPNYPDGVQPLFYLNRHQENGIKTNLFSHHASNNDHNNNNNDNGAHREHTDTDDGIVESKDVSKQKKFNFRNNFQTHKQTHLLHKRTKRQLFPLKTPFAHKSKQKPTIHSSNKNIQSDIKINRLPFQHTPFAKDIRNYPVNDLNGKKHVKSFSQSINSKLPKHLPIADNNKSDRSYNEKLLEHLRVKTTKNLRAINSELSPSPDEYQNTNNNYKNLHQLSHGYEVVERQKRNLNYDSDDDNNDLSYDKQKLHIPNTMPTKNLTNIEINLNISLSDPEFKHHHHDNQTNQTNYNDEINEFEYIPIFNDNDTLMAVFDYDYDDEVDVDRDNVDYENMNDDIKENNKDDFDNSEIKHFNGDPKKLKLFKVIGNNTNKMIPIYLNNSSDKISDRSDILISADNYYGHHKPSRYYNHNDDEEYDDEYDGYGDDDDDDDDDDSQIEVHKVLVKRKKSKKKHYQLVPIKVFKKVRITKKRKHPIIAYPIYGRVTHHPRRPHPIRLHRPPVYSRPSHHHNHNNHYRNRYQWKGHKKVRYHKLVHHYRF